MKKKLAVILPVLIICSLIGCGKSGSGSGSGDSKGASGKVTEIELWHYFDQTDQPVIEACVKKYNELQDEIEINVTYVAREELMNQYTIGAVSGELPDIGMVDSPDMASYISLGVFEDCTDEFTKWGELDQFYDGPLASCKDADGKLYGLPQNSNCLALVSNMNLLKAAGYDQPPASLAEFQEMVAATTDPEQGVYGFSMSAISTEEGTFQLLPWLSGTQAGSLGAVTDLSGAASVKGLAALGDFIANGQMSKECVNWTQADAFHQFAAGKAAMEALGTWQLPMMKDGVKGAFEYQVSLLPTGDEGTSSSAIGGENFGVCSGAEKKEACIDFLKWLGSAEQQAEFCADTGRLPTRSDVTVSYNYEQDMYEVYMEQMNYGKARGPHAEWPVISEAIYSAAQSVFVNGADAKEALAAAADKIDPILKENPLPEQ